MAIVLLDGSKFERLSVVKFSDLSDIDMLVTDAAPTASLKEALRKCGVAVEVAKPKYRLENAKFSV
jgi:DeoR/GlpR family transcriptional regulator of sugar metabolism